MDLSPALSQFASLADPPAITRNLGLRQAYVLRLIAFNLAEVIAGLPAVTDEETLRARAQSIASLIRAFAEADERARIARGKPLPGSLRPERKPKTKRRPAVSPVRVAPVSDAPKPSTEPAP